MKNLVKVRRFNDNAVRLYEAPLALSPLPGTPVEVEFAGGTAMGVTVTGCYRVDEAGENMLIDMLGIFPGTEYKRVTAAYIRQGFEPDVPAEGNAPDQPDAAADDGADEDTADTGDEA